MEASAKLNECPDMTDLLEYVRERLVENTGDLRRVADESGISYDTCHRIKNGEGDPGYSKVRVLARYFTAREKALAASASKGRVHRCAGA